MGVLTTNFLIGYVRYTLSYKEFREKIDYFDKCEYIYHNEKWGLKKVNFHDLSVIKYRI